jgi:adenylosuccinate synthase
MRIFLVLIFMSAACLVSMPPAHAKPPKLESIYGEDLMKVPQLIKVKYLNDTGKAWESTDIDERAEFLAEWQKSKMEEKDQEKSRAKEIGNEKKLAAEHERNRALKKQIKAKELADKEKAKAAEKKAADEKKRALKKKRIDAMSDLKKAQAERNKK